jgi:hypothetical protein
VDQASRTRLAALAVLLAVAARCRLASTVPPLEGRLL